VPIHPKPGLYQGTKCDADGVKPLHCYNDGSDGDQDHISGFLAPADGWYTIVVDGRMAFDEDLDWGPYNLAVKVACSEPDCCCP